MPGGLPLFRGTHPDYEGPTLPDVTIAEEEAYSEPEMLASAVQEVQGDPKTLSEARSRADWPLWKAAMEKEIAMLERAGTWTTVPRPSGRNVVGS
jgi:hypothetical protein